jgi:hypothetical protein
LLALLAPFAAAWPAAVLAEDRQGWSAVFFSGPVTEGSRLLAWFDGHARFGQDGEQLDTTILRPGVGWRVGPKLDLWVGYARIDSPRPGADVEEDRTWQQASFPIGEFGGGRLAGRTRLEQRFRDTGDDTGWRLRQFFRFARPLASDPRFGLLLSTEVFIGLGDADWGQRSGFDQNRAVFGGYYQPSPSWRIEAGYMHQYIRVAGASADRTNHNLSLSFFSLL